MWGNAKKSNRALMKSMQSQQKSLFAYEYLPFTQIKHIRYRSIVWWWFIHGDFMIPPNSQLESGSETSSTSLFKYFSQNSKQTAAVMTTHTVDSIFMVSRMMIRARAGFFLVRISWNLHVCSSFQSTHELKDYTKLSNEDDIT